jgi:hypothetical protein
MNSAFEIFRMMSAAADSFSKYAWCDPAQGRPMSTEDSQRMMRLYMAFVNSGYRYLARWAEISAKRYPEFAQTIASMSDKPEESDRQVSTLMDSARAYMREMAELPLEESQRLQAEIEAIMGTGKPPAEPGGKPAGKRRSRAKR